MNDTISRRAAIDALHMDIDIIPYAKAREYARAVIETVYNRLEQLPAVQPEPSQIARDIATIMENEQDMRVILAQPQRMRGRWIDGHCSICGCDIPAYIIDWKWQKDMDAKFCPNCGADMRGEQE